MKKVLFAVPALAMALLFTFCNKTSVQEEINPANSEIGVSERGNCTIEIYADNLNQLRICGITANNMIACNQCPSGAASNGVEVVFGFASYNVVSPMTFSITNAGATPTFVRVATPGSVGTGWIQLAANGGCEDFDVDDNCKITF